MQRDSSPPTAAGSTLRVATTPSRPVWPARLRIRDLNPLKWTVRFLASVRVAMVLILLIAAIVLVGTIIDQAPPAVIANQAAYERWMATARARYGGWTDLLNQLQLFNVFHSM